MLQSKPGDGLLRRGLLVFVGLVVLTLVEFAVAISSLPGLLLFVIALAKLALILVYYMHIRVLTNLDGEGGH